MSWGSSMNAARANLLAACSKDAKAIAAQFCEEVIKATPVLNGHLKGDWTATTNAPAATGRDRADPAGSLAIAEMRSVINALPKDKDWQMYFTNNRPYAQVVEYLGHSPKAPHGMVRIQFSKLALIVSNALSGSRS